MPNEATTSPSLPARAWQFRYRAELDGIRGLSVAAVLAFHAGLVVGGYLGVTCFFVLSGFLITSILLEEWDATKHISLRNFFVRRALRLLPAVYAVLIVTLGLSQLSILEKGRVTPAAALYVFFYVSNWARAFLWCRLGVVDHTWSLAIEEQFYLLWPLLLLTCLRRRVRPRALVALLLVAIAASTCLRAFLYRGPSDFRRVASGTDTMADALLIGVLTAVALRTGALGNWRSLADRRAFRALTLAGVALVIWMTMSISHLDPMVYQRGLTLVALTTAAVILWVVTVPSAALSRCLTFPPLAWAGRLSYGIYLWHVPVFRMVEKLPVSGRYLLPLVQILVSLVVAAISYYGFERYFMRLKRRFES